MEDKEKIESCAKEIKEILDKHNCDFLVTMLITQQGNIPQIQVVTKN